MGTHELSGQEAWREVFQRYYYFTLGSIGLVIFFFVWEYVGTSGLVNPIFTSSPTRVIKALIDLAADGTLWKHVRISGIEFGLGFSIAAVTGIILGILSGWYRDVNSAIEPFVTIFNSIPTVAFMSFIIIWAGIGIWSKVIIIFLSTVFPIIINTCQGVRVIDANLLKAARSFGATDRDIFYSVALPSSVPYIISGLRLGIGRALVGIVVGEMYASTAGLGHLIAISGATFQTDQVFVGVAFIATAGIITQDILRRLELKFDSWRS